MDIVYILKEQNRIPELWYSIRSLENLPHDKVFFVGGFPIDINPEKVIHIPTKQTSTKWDNSTNNLKTACQDDRISGDFILFNDDFFIMSKIEDPVKELNLNRGTIDSVIEEYKQLIEYDSPYLKGMAQTKKLLNNKGFLNPLSFELHIPMVINKRKMLDVLSMPELKELEVVHKRTLYGNLCTTGSTYCKDVKIDFYHPGMPENSKFLSTSDGKFLTCKSFLSILFNKKSEYEL